MMTNDSSLLFYPRNPQVRSWLLRSLKPSHTHSFPLSLRLHHPFPEKNTSAPPRVSPRLSAPAWRWFWPPAGPSPWDTSCRRSRTWPCIPACAWASLLSVGTNRSLHSTYGHQHRMKAKGISQGKTSVSVLYSSVMLVLAVFMCSL